MPSMVASSADCRGRGYGISRPDQTGRIRRYGVNAAEVRRWFDAGGPGNVDFSNWWRSTRWLVHARRAVHGDCPGRHRPRPCRHRAVAQLARVPVSKTGGWGFESLLPCECGP